MADILPSVTRSGGTKYNDRGPTETIFGCVKVKVRHSLAGTGATRNRLLLVIARPAANRRPGATRDQTPPCGHERGARVRPRRTVRVCGPALSKKGMFSFLLGVFSLLKVACVVRSPGPGHEERKKILSQSRYECRVYRRVCARARWSGAAWWTTLLFFHLWIATFLFIFFLSCVSSGMIHVGTDWRPFF